VCVFITAVPIIKLFALGEGDSGGHVLRETTSRGPCVFITAVPNIKLFAWFITAVPYYSEYMCVFITAVPIIKLVPGVCLLLQYL
jgi:hypothetical protein